MSNFSIKVKWVSPVASTGWERDDIVSYEFLGNGALCYVTQEDPQAVQITKQYDTIKIWRNEAEKL